MWLSDRRNVLKLLVAASGLAACGFEPIYAPGGAANWLVGKVALETPDGRMGFALREQLVARLGIAESPSYFLTVVVEVDEVGLAITPDGKITRYNLTGTAHFELVSVNGGAPIMSDSTRAFTAYSATGSAYATRVAEQDARRRLAVTLADRIATQLAVTAERWLE